MNNKFMFIHKKKKKVGDSNLTKKAFSFSPGMFVSILHINKHIDCYAKHKPVYKAGVCSMKSKVYQLFKHQDVVRKNIMMRPSYRRFYWLWLKMNLFNSCLQVIIKNNQTFNTRGV